MGNRGIRCKQAGDDENAEFQCLRKESEIVLLQKRLHEIGGKQLRDSIHQRKVLRRPSEFSDLMHLCKSANGIQLSQRDRLLVLEAFPKHANDVKQMGLTIFRSVFRQHPQMMSTYFGFAELQSVKKTLESAKLQRIASQFMGVIEMAINCLENLPNNGALDDAMGPYLHEVGAMHASLDKPYFLAEHWDSFADALCECASSWKIKGSRLETLCAWRLVVFFVINRIRQGYEFEKCSSSTRSL